MESNPDKVIKNPKEVKIKKVTIQDLIKNIGGDETLTKRRYRRRSKNSREPENTLYDNIRLEKDAALMIDILELPIAALGYRYCLVCVDLASHEFDIEKMKNKDSETVLQSFKKMTTRKYIQIPKFYMINDQGNEWKSVFHKYLWDHDVFQKNTLKGRHKSLSMVDSLIAQLGRIFNAYMNSKEEKSGKVFKNWTDIIDTVREQLNKIRKVELPKSLKDDNSQALVQTTEDTAIINKKTGKPEIISKFKKPKFKVGDMVYRLLENDNVENILGKKQTGKARMGDVRIDRTAHKITEIVYPNGKGDFARYLLQGIKGASYDEVELRKFL